MFSMGIGLSKNCFKALQDPDIDHQTKKMNSTAKIMVADTIIEALIIITTLVVGILGALGILSMHAALAYTLIGTGSLFTAGWIVVAVTTKGDFFKAMAELILHGFGCIDASDSAY